MIIDVFRFHGLGSNVACLLQYNRVVDNLVYVWPYGHAPNWDFPIPISSGEFVSIEKDDTYMDNSGHLMEKDRARYGRLPLDYMKFKGKHMEDLANFPQFVAHTDEELLETMKAQEITSTEEIISIGNNHFIKKDDVLAYMGVLMRYHDNLLKRCIQDFPDHDFAYEMFYVELTARAYSKTHDYQPTIEALGIDIEDLRCSRVLHQALSHVCQDITGIKKAFETIKREANIHD